MARILIVEDSPFQTKILTDKLQLLKHNIVSAKDGAEAMGLLQDEEYDCVLLDLLMPAVTGLEVLKYIRNRKIHTPVIVISANIQKTTKAECEELGAFCFINKPVNDDELNANLSNALIEKKG